MAGRDFIIRARQCNAAPEVAQKQGGAIGGQKHKAYLPGFRAMVISRVKRATLYRLPWTATRRLPALIARRALRGPAPSSDKTEGADEAITPI